MSITVILILITVGISWFSWKNPTLLDNLLMNPVRIERNKEYYRFITSGFVHADFMHLFFNMMTLWFVGETIEQIFMMLFGNMGVILYLALYIIGIVVSDLPSFFKNRKNSNYNSLGASGGVSAILFSAILIAPLMKVCLYFAICMPGFVFGFLFLAYSYYESRRGQGYINHDAHMYGALFGVVFMGIIYPSAVPNFFSQISSWSLF